MQEAPLSGIFKGMTPLLAGKPRSDRAFERMYQKHVGDVYRYALVVLRNPDDAEDVTQTTFMNAYRAFRRGERPRTPQNWLITIAHNVCRQRFRQSMRRPNELPLEEELAEAQVPDDDAPTADDIRRALGHLAFNQRAALVMRELEGRSYTEIADVLGVTTSAVETLIFRARRALREQLEGGLTCHEAELAISRQLDRRLGRAGRGQLRAHLRECEECARFARSQRAQRSAIRGLAAIPVPTSLTHFFHGGGGAAAGGAAASGAGIGTALTGVGAKVALIGATALVATGVGVEASRKANWHPLAKTHHSVAAPASKSRTVRPFTPGSVADVPVQEALRSTSPRKRVLEARVARNLHGQPLPGRGAQGKGKGLAVGATGSAPPGKAIGRQTAPGQLKKTAPVQAKPQHPVHPTHPVRTHPTKPVTRVKPPPPVKSHPKPPPPPPPASPPPPPPGGGHGKK